MSESENKSLIALIIIVAAAIIIAVLIAGIYIFVAATKAILNLMLSMPDVYIFAGSNSDASLALLVMAAMIVGPFILAFISGFIDAAVGDTQESTLPVDPSNQTVQTEKQEGVSQQILDNLIDMPDEDLIEIINNTSEQKFNVFLESLDRKQLEDLQRKIINARNSSKSGQDNIEEYNPTNPPSRSDIMDSSNTDDGEFTGDSEIDEILKEIDEEERADWV